jgi:UDP-N-acetyl-D-mannosaminuronic acid dehydrogenase
MSNRLTVTGAGRIGLPLAVLAAKGGYEVVAVDRDPNLVAAIGAAAVTGQEPEVAELLDEAVASGRLTASTEPTAAPLQVICVPSPLTADGHADLAALEEAAESVGSVLRDGDLVVVETTVPVGTTESLVRTALAKASGLAPESIRVAYSPERLLPGQTIAELISNARVVGAMTDADGAEAEAFYRSFVQGEVITTDTATAEFVKLSENAYRDINIAIANSLLLVARASGVDVHEARRIANLHPRVELLAPGPGVGGHCLTSDPIFLLDGTEGPDGELIASARSINDRMPAVVAQEIDTLTTRRPSTVLILGTAYKAGVGDERESPSLALGVELEALGHRVLLHDTVVPRGDDLASMVRDADVLALLVAHDAYAGLHDQLGQASDGLIVYDATGTLDAADWTAAARFGALGRPQIAP